MFNCKKGYSTAKDLLKKLTPELETTIDKVLYFTEKLINCADIPGVQQILAIIPGEAVVQAALNSAINFLTKTDAILKEQKTSAKISLFMAELNTLSPQMRNTLMQKWASLTTGILHGAQYTEKVYDTLVQVKTNVIPADIVK